MLRENSLVVGILYLLTAGGSGELGTDSCETKNIGF
jgi:hypothetical protein